MIYLSFSFLYFSGILAWDEERETQQEKGKLKLLEFCQHLDLSQAR